MEKIQTLSSHVSYDFEQPQLEIILWNTSHTNVMLDICKNNAYASNVYLGLHEKTR
jgi:hypothetical protein